MQNLIIEIIKRVARHLYKRFTSKAYERRKYIGAVAALSLLILCAYTLTSAAVWYICILYIHSYLNHRSVTYTVIISMLKRVARHLYKRFTAKAYERGEYIGAVASLSLLILCAYTLPSVVVWYICILYIHSYLNHRSVTHTVIIPMLKRAVRYHAKRLKYKAYRRKEGIITVVVLSLVIIAILLFG